MEQNGLELKNRLLNFHGTLMNNNLLNLFFALKHRTKSIVFLAALPVHRCTLSSCIIIMNGPKRNGKTDRHLWKKSDVHV